MSIKLFKNSFFYILGDVLNRSMPFLMIPVFTRYLTPEDYGIISVFTVLISVFAVFTGLSTHGAININYYKMEKNELRGFIGNCIIILNISTLCVFIFVLLAHHLILESIQIGLEWLFFTVLLAFANFLTTMNLNLWMVEQKPKPYIIYQFSQTFIITAFSLVLIIYFGMNWKGYLSATATGILLFSVLSLAFIIKRKYFLFLPSKKHIKTALKFGIPMIPHTLGIWLKTGADRIILISILGATSTGVYSVGYQIGMVISVLATAFNKAWSPYLFRILSFYPTLENKKKIVKFTYLYFLLILLFACFFTYITELILPHLLGKKFIEASHFIKYFALAFSFQGMYFMVTNYIFFVEKTHFLAYVTFGTALLHIILLYFLIKLNGAIGAAQASVISFATTFFLVWFIASKLYKMPWNFWKIKKNN